MYQYVDLLVYLCFLGALGYGVWKSSTDDSVGEVWLWVGIVGVFAYPVVLETLAHLLAAGQRLFKQHLTPPTIRDYKGYPIVYCDDYNITACGLEKIHPFDSIKYRRGNTQSVANMLVESGALPSSKVFISPSTCPRYILQEVHSFPYLLSLSYSLCVAKVVEVPVCCVPAPLLRLRVLTPMLHATYGSLCN